MTRKSWFKVVAKHDGGHAEILIYDEIGRNFFGEGIAAEDLVKELAALDVQTIDVRINSAGGQLFEGLAIFNALKRHQAKVTTHIDGMAASIASIIALAGEEVLIADNAFMMIHNPHGFEVGDANAMRKMADILDTVGGSLVDIYAEKTGASDKVIRAMMDEETWFNAAEALEAGLVDETVEAMDVAAKFDLSKFQNVRADVLERVARQDKPPPAAKADEELEEKLDVAIDLVQLAAESEKVLADTLL